MHTRATTMADAFINATVKVTKEGKVDHQRGTGNWMARRVALNCERPGFAVVREFDKSPPKPAPRHVSLEDGEGSSFVD